jgi:hypothetical protein
MLTLFDATHRIELGGQGATYAPLGLLAPGGLGQQPRRKMLALAVLRFEHNAILLEDLKRRRRRNEQQAIDAEARRLAQLEEQTT